jgi:tRNA (guanine37-N1)-methyltransferase
MRFDILSLFPGYFSGPFDESIVRRAREAKLVEINSVDIRTFAEGRHRVVDDRPYGGGPGMVMQAEPVAKAIRSCRSEGSRVIYLSPQGAPLTAQRARALAAERHLILLCGHYEGIDQRVLDAEVDEEISIGDYVLTNGCLPAIVLIDAIVRFLPGVLGDSRAASEDSFEQGLLDCPHYTRPEEWEGREVPAALLSGSHREIAGWRHQRALETTERMRPDLYWSHLYERAGWSAGEPLLVSDLQRSYRFYRDLLGFKKGEERAGAIEVGPLTLVSGVPQAGGLLRHRLESERAFMRHRDQLQEKGIAFEVICEKDDNKALQLIDPDGYVWWISWNNRSSENE